MSIVVSLRIYMQGCNVRFLWSFLLFNYCFAVAMFDIVHDVQTFQKHAHAIYTIFHGCKNVNFQFILFFLLFSYFC